MNTAIGIAGGSGVGKSTLAISLCKKYPEKFCLVHVDDYFKKADAVPRYEGMINYDHPEAIRFDDLYTDMQALMSNQPITVLTKSELYHPHYSKELKNKIAYQIEPKPIIILEGYLALYAPCLRDFMSFRIYLDMSITDTVLRRTKFMDDDYTQKVLIPMHNQFVEPTKQYADVIVDVNGKTPDILLQILEEKLIKNRL